METRARNSSAPALSITQHVVSPSSRALAHPSLAPLVTATLVRRNRSRPASTARGLPSEATKSVSSARALPRDSSEAPAGPGSSPSKWLVNLRPSSTPFAQQSLSPSISGSSLAAKVAEDLFCYPPPREEHPREYRPHPVEAVQGRHCHARYVQPVDNPPRPLDDQVLRLLRPG